MIKFEADEILIGDSILFFNKIKTQLKTERFIWLSIFLAVLIYAIINKYHQNGALRFIQFTFFMAIFPYVMLVAKIQLQAYGVKILEKKLIKKLSSSNNFSQISIITVDGQLYEYTFPEGKGPITTRNPQRTMELSFVFPFKFFSTIANCTFLRIEVDKKRFYLIPKIFSLEDQLVRILL